MFEQLYASSADGYLLLQELLGAAAADWRRIPDSASAEYLMALSAQMQSDLARARGLPADPARSAAVFSLKSQFRFRSPDERETFSRALRSAVVEVIARHTSPYLRPDGRDAPGEPFRLVLGFYPYAAETPMPS